MQLILHPAPALHSPPSTVLLVLRPPRCWGVHGTACSLSLVPAVPFAGFLGCGRAVTVLSRIMYAVGAGRPSRTTSTVASIVCSNSTLHTRHIIVCTVQFVELYPRYIYNIYYELHLHAPWGMGPLSVRCVLETPPCCVFSRMPRLRVYDR